MPEVPSTMTPSMTAMHAILSADHGATVADLAERGNLGRSTAAKVLTGLEARGLARRQAAERTGARRAPDLWFLAASDEPAQPAPAVDDDTAAASSSEPESGTTPKNAPHRQQSPSTPTNPAPRTPRLDDQIEPNDTPEPDGSVPDADADGGTVDEARPAPVADAVSVDQNAVTETGGDAVPGAVSSGPDPALETASEGKAQPSGSEDAAPPQVARPAAAADSPGGTRASRGQAPAADPSKAGPVTPSRLPKGGLRALVTEHLAAHPDEEFTAPKLSKELNRSSGAIANVFDTLVKDGEAEMTREKPRTFRLLAQAER